MVSQEKSAAPQALRIKIPDLCTAFGLSHVDLIEMLRRLGIRA